MSSRRRPRLRLVHVVVVVAAAATAVVLDALQGRVAEDDLGAVQLDHRQRGRGPRWGRGRRLPQVHAVDDLAVDEAAPRVLVVVRVHVVVLFVLQQVIILNRKEKQTLIIYGDNKLTYKLCTHRRFLVDPHGLQVGPRRQAQLPRGLVLGQDPVLEGQDDLVGVDVDVPCPLHLEVEEVHRGVDVIYDAPYGMPPLDRDVVGHPPPLALPLVLLAGRRAGLVRWRLLAPAAAAAVLVRALPPAVPAGEDGAADAAAGRGHAGRHVVLDKQEQELSHVQDHVMYRELLPDDQEEGGEGDPADSTTAASAAVVVVGEAEEHAGGGEVHAAGVGEVLAHAAGAEEVLAHAAGVGEVHAAGGGEVHAAGVGEVLEHDELKEQRD